MKKDVAKLCVCITLILCSEKLLSQKLTAQKDSLLTWQMKRDTAGKTVKSFAPTFHSTIATTPAVSTSSINDSKDVRVFPSPNIQSEVHISIDKNNPNSLVASANTLLGAQGGKLLYNQGYYFTWDGGKTWSGADFLQNAHSQYILGDPATAFANNHFAYLTTIDFNFNDFSYGYLFQKSKNGGDTWSWAREGRGAQYYTFGFDKLMIAADNSPSSQYVNNFYAAWTDFSVGNGEVLFNMSSDYGNTFTTPVILRTNIGGFGQGANVQTGPDGQIYVCWADHSVVEYPYRADGLGFTASMNGGATFKPAKIAFKYNGTRTFSDDPTYNYVRVADFPSMAVDKSWSAHRGRIYVAYPTKENGIGKSIVDVRHSDDEGMHWSKPVTVSISRGKQNFFPWIAVDDATGEVWVVYFSFDEPAKYATNTYVAHSSDGGATWESQKVSDVSHITAPINDKYFASGYAGDYIGIAAYGGKAYPIWQDDRNGTWQLYCSPISSSTPKSSDVSKASVSETERRIIAGPNPVKNTLQLQVFNEEINNVQLINESGTIVKQWNKVTTKSFDVADVAPGMYILKITGKENKVYTQKIIKQ